MAFMPQTLHSGADNADDGTEVLDTEVIRVSEQAHTDATTITITIAT